MTFVSRQINISFMGGAGIFKGNTDFTGLRISAHIDGPGGEDGMIASAAIWGMPLSTMNQLSIVGRQVWQASKNKVSIMAGDATSGMRLVFIGDITSAYVDAQSQPDVCFRIEARPNGYFNAANAAVTSIKGQSEAGQVFQQLAQKCGLGFQNYGVNAQLRNLYLPSSYGKQIKLLARMVGCEHIIDRGTLSVWKPGENKGGNTFLSRQTGMVGYPAFDQRNIIVRSIFNPEIRNPNTITVQSDITPACGTWHINHVTHEIESQMPNGKWFTTVLASPPGSDGGAAP
jgi:hypothetical protein